MACTYVRDVNVNVKIQSGHSHSTGTKSATRSQRSTLPALHHHKHKTQKTRTTTHRFSASISPPHASHQNLFPLHNISLALNCLKHAVTLAFCSMSSERSRKDSERAETVSHVRHRVSEVSVPSKRRCTRVGAGWVEDKGERWWEWEGEGVEVVEVEVEEGGARVLDAREVTEVDTASKTNDRERSQTRWRVGTRTIPRLLPTRTAPSTRIPSSPSLLPITHLRPPIPMDPIRLRRQCLCLSYPIPINSLPSPIPIHLPTPPPLLNLLHDPIQQKVQKLMRILVHRPPKQLIQLLQLLNKRPWRDRPRVRRVPRDVQVQRAQRGEEGRRGGRDRDRERLCLCLGCGECLCGLCVEVRGEGGGRRGAGGVGEGGWVVWGGGGELEGGLAA